MTLTADRMKMFRKSPRMGLPDMPCVFLRRLAKVIAVASVALIASGPQAQLHAQSIAAMVNGEAITNGDITILNSFGLPRDRSGINNGIEFTLPPNQTEFELVLLDAGAPTPMTMLVDGKLTNAGGYNVENGNTGGTKYSRIVLPSSLSARKVTLDFGARPFIGLRLPSRSSLKSWNLLLTGLRGQLLLLRSASAVSR